MTAVLDAGGSANGTAARWALRDCTLTIPEQSIVGLTGPNSAGKSTLLGLAVGLLSPDEGRSRSRSARPPIADVGYVAQDAPLYRVVHRRRDARLRPLDERALGSGLALELLGSRSLETKVSALSPGERARLALALALGKRPTLLLLDEPLASLDRLAGREFLQVADGRGGPDRRRRRDRDARRHRHRARLRADRTALRRRRAARGLVEDLLARHRLLTGARRPLGRIRGVEEVVRERHSGRQLTLLVRTNGPIVDPTWTVDEIGLEDLLLAYMAPERVADACAARSVEAAMAWVTWRQHRSQLRWPRVVHGPRDRRGRQRASGP